MPIPSGIVFYDNTFRLSFQYNSLFQLCSINTFCTFLDEVLSAPFSLPKQITRYLQILRREILIHNFIKSYDFIKLLPLTQPLIQTFMLYCSWTNSWINNRPLILPKKILRLLRNFLRSIAPGVYIQYYKWIFLASNYLHNNFNGLTHFHYFLIRNWSNIKDYWDVINLSC